MELTTCGSKHVVRRRLHASQKRVFFIRRKTFRSCTCSYCFRRMERRTLRRRFYSSSRFFGEIDAYLRKLVRVPVVCDGHVVDCRRESAVVWAGRSKHWVLPALAVTLYLLWGQKNKTSAKEIRRLRMHGNFFYPPSKLSILTSLNLKIL